MLLAGEELGREAMLVQSKRTTADTRHMGQYEVVFALQDQPEPVRPSFQQVLTSTSEADARGTAIEQLSAELGLLKRRIENMSRTLATAEQPASPSIQRSKRRQSLVRSLIERDVRPDLAEALVTEGAGDASALRDAVEN